MLNESVVGDSESLRKELLDEYQGLLEGGFGDKDTTFLLQGLLQSK
jgi:hypothetical protein